MATQHGEVGMGITKYVIFRQVALKFSFCFAGTMASVRKKGKYTADDPVEECILGRVAQNVNYSKLKQFAKHLKISQSDYERITASSVFVIHQINEVGNEKISLQPYVDFVDMSI